MTSAKDKTCNINFSAFMTINNNVIDLHYKITNQFPLCNDNYSNFFYQH